MKSKIAFSVTFLLLSHFVFTQNYLPIVNDSQNIQFEVCHPIFDGTLEETYEISGDTLINDLTYFKIKTNDIEGFFRQDSSNAKAWFKEVNGAEKLIMDLNLTVGDSIFIDCDKYGRRYSKVTSIDTIGTRKTVELDYIYPEVYATPTDTIIYRTLKFIEGIGPTGFFLYQIEDVDFHNYGFILRTVRKNGYFVYSEFENCYDLVPVSTKNLDQVHFQIFPNPTSDFIEIKSDHPVEDLKIYNITGQLISQQFIPHTNTKWDLTALESGLYFVNFRIKDRNITEIIVKN
ncbi:T9SS type A sorting domain-containing protein [Portibacter lacus]|uniref:Secretion system C-terminal sorting domain-containing protein n=1 Tax=Portibacter lacus TaxID=1099794 RepID=A0AA37SRW6_9BACT|nr:T9SS type A sorting domain-containing protein [Portibacter lacus]GLR17751.1 hypothetical protein GCM10007940_23660 [Portibacter lacus]